MLDFLTKTFTSIFGSKQGRDIKLLAPRVEQIKEEYAKLQSLSNDELRNKTRELKERIAEFLKDIDTELADIDTQLEENPDMEVAEKDRLFKRQDDLKKERDQELEKVLDDILAEAFAVVKETARRFKENEQLDAIPTDLDRELAAKSDHITITGNSAVFSSTWNVRGNPTKWDMLHYDVQLMGGLVLHQGKIAEMATGEGKTLVSTLPAYLNALSGQGVHIVTVNDYLAKRDSEWNGPIYSFLGLTVDCIEHHQPNSPERKKAYLADITYGTNNEFGFDYLRDNMARDPEDMVQRKHHYTLVDEVDSVLIDDARTPLIISGPTQTSDQDQERFSELKPRVERLSKLQRDYVHQALNKAKQFLKEGNEKEGGLFLLRAHRGLPKYKPLIKFLGESGRKAILQRTENYYLQDQQREMPKADKELYFVIDEKNNSIELTDRGIEEMTDEGEDVNFFLLPDVGTRLAEIERNYTDPDEQIMKKDELMRDFAIKSERIHTVNQLLKAYNLFEKDVEYIIQDSKVKIVDEQTGRVMEGRRYSDGLHQAIEAKENVTVEASTQTFATVTLQNYFRMYHKLAGMTGTAETEAGEFWEIYKLDVVVIPTNKPIIRDDREDFVYKTQREKFNAVIEDIQRLVNAGRPVLVGTTSVESSELVSRMLKMRNIRHNVLNAKQHQREAQIVAEAGQPGVVTIATNMAGRGTDIKITPEVRKAGGLAIVGTERHESRRVDRQLRGRAGRQGDPGSTQFFVSLDDNLMRIFGSERIAKAMDRLGLQEGEVIQHSMVTKSIERAQRKVEQNNFGIRKRLLEYDDVMNRQREYVYGKRRHALYGERLTTDIDQMLEDTCESVVADYQAMRDYQGLELEVLRLFATDLPFDEEEFLGTSQSIELSEKLYDHVAHAYRTKSQAIMNKAWPVIKHVYEERGKTIENIVVPFTDGQKVMHVITNLEKAYKSEAKTVVRAFERTANLALIDEAWKEHLRELDHLKQSVQAAVYEQKDPLLIYKIESVKLFQEIISRINKDVLSLLFKGNILSEQPDDVREARAPRRQDMRGMKLSRSETPGQENGAPGGGAQVRTEPVRVGEKVGRNDPCPCGSGKKYKQCHGKNA